MQSSYSLAIFPPQIKAELTHQLEKLNTLSHTAFLRTCALSVLMALWQDESQDFPPLTLLDKKLFQQLNAHQKSLAAFYRALLKKSDPFFLKAARLETQACFNRLQEKLALTPPSNNADKLKVELATANMLSIYSMFTPTPHETVTIPQFIGENWVGIDYEIEPIEMSPTRGIWSLPITEESRLFSYGFIAKNNNSLPRLLVHCGTGWPTAQGIDIQIMADFWPDKTPGEVFFIWQKKAINHWLDSAPSKLITVGQSLGGSTAYLTALHRPDKILKAICLVPPGMPYDYSSEHLLFGAWEKCPKNKRPQVIIQKQKADPISKCGVFKKDFILLKIQRPKIITKNPFINLLGSHASNFSACDTINIEQMNTQVENLCSKRKANNTRLYGKRIFIFYSLLIPYFFIIKPINYALKNSALTFSLTVLLSISCLLFSSVSATALSISCLLGFNHLYLSYFFFSYGLSYTLDKLSRLTFDLLFNNLLTTRQYFHQLSCQSPLNLLNQILFDTTNLISLNALCIGLALINTVINGVNHLVFYPPPTEACIHSAQQHQMTKNLNTYAPPSFEDRYQTLGLIMLLFTAVIPLKLMHDALTYFLDACHTIQSQTSKKFSKKKAGTFQDKRPFFFKNSIEITTTYHNLIDITP